MKALLLALLATACEPLEESASTWRLHGREQLDFAMQNAARAAENAHAKNVILFIGDGMGMSTVTAAGMFKGGEGHRLLFERFPFTGLSKTYSVNKQVGDSAATGTAFLTGVKTRNAVLGLDGSVEPESCVGRGGGADLDSLATMAQAAGRVAGVVTTTRITHATPGALYAKIGFRDWECDSKKPVGCQIMDIARQLVEELPGRELKVILGGGQKQLGFTPATFDDKTDDSGSCGRADSRNLTELWLKQGGRRLLVSSRDQLMDADLSKVDYLMGLFSNGHIPYVGERRPEHPSLVDMTTQAVKMLSKNKKGFFLLVEGGRVDHAHHANRARQSLMEAVELEEAVSAALALTNRKDTLVVVTADHSHTLTISGYPEHGNDIMGLAQEPNATAYETLSYANGPSFYDHRSNSSGVNNTWNDVSQMNRSSAKYRSFSPRYLADETHGGEDVPVYAVGPGSFLFTGAYEQNYIAHAIAYVARIGPEASIQTSAASAISSLSVLLFVTVCLLAGL